MTPEEAEAAIASAGQKRDGIRIILSWLRTSRAASWAALGAFLGALIGATFTRFELITLPSGEPAWHLTLPTYILGSALWLGLLGILRGRTASRRFVTLEPGLAAALALSLSAERSAPEVARAARARIFGAEPEEVGADTLTADLEMLAAWLRTHPKAREAEPERLAALASEEARSQLARALQQRQRRPTGLMLLALITGLATWPTLCGLGLC